ncbi:MAG TPA: ABC transporter permease [Wenzhouxiangella sp.]|nr:ABC transporter permease [Wenzhouxiangella sp.]
MTTAHDRRRLLHLGVLLGPTTVFLAVFFLMPLGIMTVYSFLEPGLYGGVQWNFYHLNYGRILGWADGEIEEFDPVYIKVFLLSVRLALITVVTCLLICYPAAFWVSRLSIRAKHFCIFLVTLPFFASLVVRLFAWILILRPTGFINATLQKLGVITEPLNMMFTEGAVIVGMTYIFLPFMFLPVYASIEKLDMSYIEASSDLGANRFQTFWRIVLPLTLPGVAGGSIIVFIPSLGNFVVPQLLGGAHVYMIGNMVEQQFLYARNWPFGAALAMMVMATVLFFLLIYAVSLSRSEGEGMVRG